MKNEVKIIDLVLPFWGVRGVKSIIFILSQILISGVCHSQKEDHNWILGYHSTDSLYWDNFSINQFNFNHDPVKIYNIHDKRFSALSTCSTISKNDGAIQYFSNGMHILDNQFKVVKGGEKINFNAYWNIFLFTYPDGSDNYFGLKLSQGMLMLPYPGRDSIIWLTYNVNKPTGDIFTSVSEGIFQGIIDVKSNSVVVKDKVFFTDTISDSSLQACKHANGRDWWIIAASANHDRYFVFLLAPNGIHLINTFLQPIDYISGHGQARFSPDGTKFVSYEVIGGAGYDDQGHIIIYDFDRCTGLLSNLRYEPFLGKSIVVGCAISENSKYLYAGNGVDLYKYDLHSEDILSSKQTIAVSDGYKSVLSQWDSIPNYFGFLQLAPDGKIYGPGGNTLHMHRIEYPDEEGEECQVKQHAIKTFYNLNTVPNHPYFRLGPEDGSDCDTLGLDNHPIAKFRYEQDTTNHLNIRFTDLSYFRPETWLWDFGDGTTFEGSKPYWHEFPKNGTYNVCLTVSNENSEHTMCRLVNIGSTSNEELKVKNEKLVSLFPNPTEGEVLLTVSDYIPEYGEVYFYDMMGKEVYKQRVYYGWNNVNLNYLSNGQYIYQVFDKKNKISHGKLIKI